MSSNSANSHTPSTNGTTPYQPPNPPQTSEEFETFFRRIQDYGSRFRTHMCREIDRNDNNTTYGNGESAAMTLGILDYIQSGAGDGVPVIALRHIEF